MPTISERLRSIDEAAMYEHPATTSRTACEAADTIDALVAALEGILEDAEFIEANTPHLGDDFFGPARAALALARKGG